MRGFSRRLPFFVKGSTALTNIAEPDAAQTVECDMMPLIIIERQKRRTENEWGEIEQLAKPSIGATLSRFLLLATLLPIGTD